MRTVLEVEIWSDVVCPWCYIGKRRFERALVEVSDDIEVHTRYRPYQLDPLAPIEAPTAVSEAYAKKFGGPERAEQIIEHVTSVAAAEGVGFRMDRALRANTLRAHRLLWLAESTGHQLELKESLLKAYFVDGLDVGDVAVLADIASAVGLQRDRALSFLRSTDGEAEVADSLRFAAENDITGVPAYTFINPDGGHWLVPGAQDTEVFVRVLRRLADRQRAVAADR